MENWKGILASKCKLFSDIDTAYVPIGRIVKSGGLDAVMRFYDERGAEFSDKIQNTPNESYNGHWEILNC